MPCVRYHVLYTMYYVQDTVYVVFWPPTIAAPSGECEERRLGELPSFGFEASGTQDYTIRATAGRERVVAFMPNPSCKALSVPGGRIQKVDPPSLDSTTPMV